MKYQIVIAIIFCSSTFVSAEEVDESITIHNLSNTEQQLWVNAVSYEVPPNISLRVPCNREEEIEVQHVEDKSVLLVCGSKMELQ